MAEVVLQALIAEDTFLNGRIVVSSAGTANWHVGQPMDPRARRVLDDAGFTGPGTPGMFADSTYLNGMDLVITMTREQLRDIEDRMTSPSTETRLLRNVLEPGCNLDVADPYYGDIDDFRQCLSLLTTAGRRLTSEFRRQLGARSS